MYDQTFHLADAQLGPNMWPNTLSNIEICHLADAFLAQICDYINYQILKCTTNTNIITKFFTWRTPSLAPGSGAGMASPPPLQTSLQQIWVRNANIKFVCKMWRSSKTACNIKLMIRAIIILNYDICIPKTSLQKNCVRNANIRFICKIHLSEKPCSKPSCNIFPSWVFLMQI